MERLYTQRLVAGASSRGGRTGLQAMGRDGSGVKQVPVSVRSLCWKVQEAPALLPEQAATASGGGACFRVEIPPA